MAEYLVIDTTGGTVLTGNRYLLEAKSVPDAIALLVADAYAYEQTFSLFDLENETLIKIEQEKIIRALDGADKTDTTVLGEYTEADILVLKEEAEAAKEDPQVKQ